jgi:glycosyltransferase involved in cell wall biosynthesis
MRVHFILPTPGDVPVGGYKVVYEYANHLVKNSFSVVVSHLPRSSKASLARKALREIKDRITGRWRPNHWFKIRPEVELRLLGSECELIGIDADAVFATAWQTAPMVAALPAHCGDKYYLIQHFEEWSGDRERVLTTWRLPLTKIVIARWLGDIAASIGQRSHYVPNGLDFDAFGIDNPPTVRENASVIMLHHTYDWKGTTDGLAALRLAKQRVPNLRVQFFGVAPRPPDLEPWINFEQQPGQAHLRQLYNNAAIFISPSWAEGWPLPPAEAMACGVACILTDIGGHREYTEDAITAILVPAKDPAAMADALVPLCRDRDSRIRIAHAGHENILNYTWDRAGKRLANIIQTRQLL